MSTALKCCGVAVLVLSTAAAHSQGDQKGNPGSLFEQGTKNPFTDRIARGVGDIVTILISETSVASFAATTSANKDTGNNVLKGLGPVLQSLIPALSTSANSNFTGGGNTTHTGKFLAAMSVKVIQVLENGNLVVEGTRDIKVNRDWQIFKLSGVLRRDDIRSDNTILSEKIADAQIVAESKGIISDRQRRGIITRILDWLF
ncbi:MAG: flagellar basal body L-ring protein FlgH [Fimbriimonadaceae bacterium]